MPSPAIGLTLRLHGPPAVQSADGREFTLEGRSAALVALVAIEAEMRRERVAALLWPDSDDPRRNLRQQLLRLKRALDGADLVQGDSVLRLAPQVTLADAGAAPLLGTLQLRDCAEFQDWLDARRAQQHHADVHALEAAAAEAEAAGRYEDALVSAQRLLDWDEPSEAHHRFVMRLHYLRGDRASGLAVYEQLVRRLQARHGLAPDAATQALARALRESSTALVPQRTAVVAMPATVLRPPRLIGRDDALTALRAAWDAGHAALVLGEPGLGKSRLLAEFCAGVRVVWAAGRPGDAGVPYATLARLMRRLRELHEPALTPAQRAALACVLPDWAAPSTGATAAIGDVRLALQAAVEAWLAQAHAGGLAALVLDDLHFADSASIEAVQALIGSDALNGLRFALAARPAEIGAAGEALRTGLTEARALNEIELPPLTPAQMSALVASLGLAELDADALGPPLARHSGGNPLYALETLKQGLADGALRHGALPRPPSVGALIERRLKQLSDPALTLARVAAIAGVDFDIGLAEAVTGRSAVDLADAWSQLDAAQVLRDGAFAHDLVCDAVLRTVPAPIARRMHAQCATHLAARGGEPARLGAHWIAAGRAREAAEAYVDAARRAQRAGRRVEEAGFLATAAQGFADAGDAMRRFETLADRLDALKQADFGAEADQAVNELRALAADDRQRLRVLREQVDLYTARAQLAEAVACGEQALALARAQGDIESELRIACPMAGALGALGRAADAYDLLLPLGRWARESASVDLRHLWHGYWAMTLDGVGRLREAVLTLEDAIEHARAGSLPVSELGMQLSNLSVLHNKMGRADQAIDASERAVRLLREDPQAKGLPLLAMLTLARHLSEGARYSEALALFDEVMGPIEAGGARAWVIAGQTWLATLWMRLGQHARAAQLLAVADDDMPTLVRGARLMQRAQLTRLMSQPGQRSLVERLAALVPGEAGPGLIARIAGLTSAAPADILRAAPRWAELARAAERYGARVQALVALGSAASSLGEHERAVEAAQQARALLDDGISPEPTMYSGEAWLAIARVLRAAGRADEADAALGAGVQWVQRHAVPHVPPQFLDSFLHRNPHNRELLAAART